MTPLAAGDRAECPGGLGVGRQHAVPVDQAVGRIRRHPQPDGDLLAEAHRRQGRAAPSSSMHRCRPVHLAAAGIPQPQAVNGIRQEPIEGVSFLSTFDSAAALEVRTTQYFEMMGNRAIYKDGWLAATRHGIPWMTAGQATGFDSDVWESTTSPPTSPSPDDSRQPDKLKQLQAAFGGGAPVQRLPAGCRRPGASTSPTA